MLTRRAFRLLLAATLASALLPGRSTLAQLAGGGLDATLQQAEALIDQRKFAEAVTILEGALQQARSTYNADDPSLANVANMLAFSLGNTTNAANIARAETLFREALRIVQARPAESGGLPLSIRNNLVQILTRQGKHAEALPLAEESFEGVKAAQGPDDWRTDKARETLAIVYINAKQPDKAVPLARESLQHAEARDGVESSETIPFRNTLGMALLNAGDYKAAEPLLKKTLAIAERDLPPNHEHRITARNNLAAIYQSMGKPEEAARILGNDPGAGAGAAATDGSTNPDFVNTRAMNAISAGRYADAERDLQLALTLSQDQNGPDHPNTSVILANFALLYTHQARYADAERYARLSLAAVRRNPGPGTVAEGRGQLGLGMIYLLTNRFDDASTELEASHRILSDKLSPDHPDTLRALHNLSGLYWRTGRYQEAVTKGEEALAGLRNRLPGDNADVAVLLVNIGQSYLGLGRLDQAEERLRAAVAMFRRLGVTSNEAAVASNALANVELARGRANEAGALYREAVEVTLARKGPEHPDTCNALDNLATFHACKGEWDDAAERFEMSRRSRLAFLARTLPALSDGDQFALIEMEERLSRDGAASLGLARRDDPRMAARSAEWIVNGKGITVRAQVSQTILARDATQPEAVRLLAEREAIRSRLARAETSAASGSNPAGAPDYASLLNQEKEASRKLALALPGQGEVSRWVGMNEIRAALPTDGVLVEFLHLYRIDFSLDVARVAWQPPRYAAWIVPPVGGGEIQLIDLGPAQPIEMAVTEAIKAVRSAPGVDGTPSNEADAERLAKGALANLARLVLEPLGASLGSAKRWMLCPDAALWLVPWATLPTRDGRYALEDHLIQLGFSGRDLIEPGPVGRSEAPAIVADPDYDLGNALVLARAEELMNGPPPRRTGARPTRDWGEVKKLPRSADEAAAIAPAMESYAGAPPRMLLGAAASETMFRSLRGPKALLISTHGFFRGGPEGPSSAPSAISPMTRPILPPGDRAGSPLLRCGLALAGYHAGRSAPASGGPIDDGLLTGLEVLDADLRGTELVVLSACETALGEVRAAEGVSGLRQAFQLAGARTVVASLWQVPDEETYRMMSGFFLGLSRKGPASALREAQLALIKERRARHGGGAHPFYWAAFTLSGSPGKSWSADPLNGELPPLPPPPVPPNTPTPWTDLGVVVTLGAASVHFGRWWWNKAPGTNA